MFHNILTVCTGNICRSPVAEYLLKHALSEAGKGVEVKSAGIGALVGHPADETALALMAERSVDMDEHRAQQISTSLTRWADLILVMEKHHLEYVVSMDPTVRGKIFLLGHWSNKQVPDPYRRGKVAHQAAYEMISHEVGNWVRRV